MEFSEKERKFLLDGLEALIGKMGEVQGWMVGSLFPKLINAQIDEIQELAARIRTEGSKPQYEKVVQSLNLEED